MPPIGQSISVISQLTARVTSTSISIHSGHRPTSTLSPSICIGHCPTGVMATSTSTSRQVLPRSTIRLISGRTSPPERASTGTIRAKAPAMHNSALRSRTVLGSRGCSGTRTLGRGGAASISTGRAAWSMRHRLLGCRSRSRSGSMRSAAPPSTRERTSPISSSILRARNRRYPIIRMAVGMISCSARICGRSSRPSARQRRSRWTHSIQSRPSTADAWSTRPASPCTRGMRARSRPFRSSPANGAMRRIGRSAIGSTGAGGSAAVLAPLQDPRRLRLSAL
jgi:hypothetical protein